MEISAEVSNDCLINDRSPFVSELTEKSDAIYCLAFVSLEPKALLQLWRKFAMNYTERDILIKRHFKGGKSMVKPIVLIRNLKKEKFETG